MSEKSQSLQVELAVETVSLIGTSFTDKQEFEGVHFAAVTCIDATFHEDVVFRNCIFQTVVNFEGAFFKKNVSFESCVFRHFVMFRGADMGDRSSFLDCTFEDGLSLAAGDSSASGEKRNLATLMHIHFQKCRFNGYVTFNNREFCRSAKFVDCSFDDPPHFQNVLYHSGTQWQGSIFEKVTKGDEIRKKRAESGFRSLKRIMADVGDIERVGLFTARELQARRSRKNVRSFEKLVISIYQTVSDFGRSIVRPIFFFFKIPCP